jgi:hypothetical protein
VAAMPIEIAMPAMRLIAWSNLNALMSVSSFFDLFVRLG